MILTSLIAASTKYTKGTYNPAIPNTLLIPINRNTGSFNSDISIIVPKASLNDSGNIKHGHKGSANKKDKNIKIEILLMFYKSTCKLTLGTFLYITVSYIATHRFRQWDNALTIICQWLLALVFRKIDDATTVKDVLSWQWTNNQSLFFRHTRFASRECNTVAVLKKKENKNIKTDGKRQLAAAIDKNLLIILVYWETC